MTQFDPSGRAIAYRVDWWLCVYDVKASYPRHLDHRELRLVVDILKLGYNDQNALDEKIGLNRPATTNLASILSGFFTLYLTPIKLDLSYRER